MEGYNYVCEQAVLHIIDKRQAKELGMKFYFTGKACKRGHFSLRDVGSSTCQKCSKDSLVRYRQENKEAIRETQRKWVERNREHVAEYARKYQEMNRDYIAERGKQYYIDNIEHIRKYREENRDRRLENRRRYWQENKNNPKLIAEKTARCMLHRVLKRCGKEKDSSTCELLGYSFLDLQQHIESLFSEGMSWENTQIDHIHPISRYISEGVTDPAVINALSNLAPMYPEDNLSKRDKTLHEWLSEKGSREWDLYSRYLTL